jgi:hypothetical protein
MLFGSGLWVASPANVLYLINVRTDEKVRAFQHNGLAYPNALAVSHRLLWVANAAKNTITIMNAATESLEGHLSRKALRAGQARRGGRGQTNALSSQRGEAFDYPDQYRHQETGPDHRGAEAPAWLPASDGPSRWQAVGA